MGKFVQHTPDFFTLVKGSELLKKYPNGYLMTDSHDTLTVYIYYLNLLEEFASKNALMYWREVIGFVYVITDSEKYLKLCEELGADPYFGTPWTVIDGEVYFNAEQETGVISLDESDLEFRHKLMWEVYHHVPEIGEWAGMEIYE